MTPIERAARAIARNAVERILDDDFTMQLVSDDRREAIIKQMVDQRWLKYKADVITVIETLREPSEAMIKSGDAHDCDGERVWQAMIDAALGEG